MLVVALILMLSAAEEAKPAPGPVRLGTPGLSYVDVLESKGGLFLDRLAKQLELHGVKVTGKQEIAAVLGLERQKQLMGCDEDQASCLAELAGALGVDGLLTGSLGKAGDGYLVNLKITSSDGARTLAVVSGRADDENGLLDFLDGAAAELSRQLHAALSRSEVDVVAPPVTSRRWTEFWPLPAALGAAAIGAGAFLWVFAFQTQDDVRHARTRFDDDQQLDQRLNDGRNLERFAWVAAGCGLGLVAIGTAMGIIGKVTVSGTVGSGFGYFALSGALP
ncbi:MAG: hypothetical protein IPJ65_30435 [Archangiaceae bacterium]|nr:hypothetical protein [Archangiaceae bacterium]